MEGVTSARAELIARIKQEIADKTYKVKSQEIADKITQKLREDETATIALRKNPWTT